MYIQTKNLVIDKYDYLGINNNSRIHLIGIYRQMLSYYYLSDISSLKTFVYKNLIFAKLAVDVVANKNIQPRNTVMEEKLRVYFDEFSKKFKIAISHPEYPNFINEVYEEYVQFNSNFFKQPLNKEQYFSQVLDTVHVFVGDDNSMFCEVLDFPRDIFDAVYKIIEYFLYRIDEYRYSYDFSFLFREKLNPIMNNLFDVDCSKCMTLVLDIDKKPLDVEIFKEYFGERYGNNLYGIYLYCFKNKQFFGGNETLFDLTESKICFEILILQRFFATLSYLEEVQPITVCDGYNILCYDDYILNYLDYIQDFPFDKLCASISFCQILLYNSNIDLLTLHKKIQEKLLIITTKLYNKDISSSIKFKWYYFLQNFFKVNPSFCSSLFKDKMIFNNEELLIFANDNINEFVKYCIGKYVHFEFLFENKEFLNNCKDLLLLTELKIWMHKVQQEYEMIVESLFSNVPLQKIKSLIFQYNNASNLTKLSIPNNAMELFEFVIEFDDKIKKNKIENNKINDIEQIIMDNIKCDNPKMSVYSLRISKFDDIVSFNNLYTKVYTLLDYLKDLMFNLEYKDVLEKSKQEFEDLKKQFFEKVNYKKKKYYDTFKTKLLAEVEDGQKDLVWRKWEEIIKCFKNKENEIADSISTNEYVYEMVKEQEIELTPLLVGYIKAVEQFLCAYIHYMTQKGFVNPNNKLQAGWEKNTFGIGLEAYINKNIHNYSPLTIVKSKSDKWLQKSKYWREEARNGNLHKDNIYCKLDLENYIEGCVDLILETIKIAILFDKK